jgi:hypothetical protein
MDPRRATATRCIARKPDGTNCKSSALPGSNFCFFHDPTKAAERREAQALGGRQNRIKTLDATAPDVKIEDCGDVVALISETINQLRKGMVDPRVANSVGYLANVLIKAFEQDELETRIERLEALIERRNQTSELTMTGT